MTILSIILMGGTVMFPADIVHEILGVILFVLWAAHIWLNHRWYAALFKGKYNAQRIIRTFVNIGILVCVIFLAISGIILSNHVFTFLHIEWGLGFARIAHLLSSHWYFLFMALHIGLHVEMMGRSFHTAVHSDSENSQKKSVRRVFIARLIFILISVYGLYAFIVRGVWRYLILQQKFFFFDMEKGYVLFFVDYIAIIIMFAALIHLISLRLKS